MPKKDLTDLQQKFLDVLPDVEWNYEEAKRQAGYSAATSGFSVAQSLKEEIVAMADDILVTAAPEAAMKLVEVIRTGKPIPQAAQKVAAVTALLDRAGLGRKETLNVNVSADEGGLFILPAKRETTDGN